MDSRWNSVMLPIVWYFLIVLTILINCSEAFAKSHSKSINDSLHHKCPITPSFVESLRNLDGDTTTMTTSLLDNSYKLERLRYLCPGVDTCCSPQLQVHLLRNGVDRFRKIMQDKIVSLAQVFESKTSKLDMYFRDLMSNARGDLHQMFKRTYGIIYEQNSDIFSNFFDQLAAFYLRSTTFDGSQHTNLTVNFSRLNSRYSAHLIIDSFYDQLSKRMFSILNRPYYFDDAYFDCMGQKMKGLKPFGDVPEKMKQQITRALVGAKVFVGGMQTGRDVIRRFIEFLPNDDCVANFTRLTACQYCSGNGSLKPCRKLCVSTLNACLTAQLSFDTIWNEYLDSLLALLERIQGPYNIELVIDPINVKISDAIMTFQEKGNDITNQIFEDCGSPKIQRRTMRSHHEAAASTEFIGTGSVITTLVALAKEIKDKVATTRNFWKHLPNSMCNDESLSQTTKTTKKCWKGAKIQWKGFSKNFKSEHESHIFVVNQIEAISMATYRMRRAYKGESVDFEFNVFSNSTGDSHALLSNVVPTKSELLLLANHSTSRKSITTTQLSFEGSGSLKDFEEMGSGSYDDLQTDDEDLLLETGTSISPMSSTRTGPLNVHPDLQMPILSSSLQNLPFFPAKTSSPSDTGDKINNFTMAFDSRQFANSSNIGVLNHTRQYSGKTNQAHASSSISHNYQRFTVRYCLLVAFTLFFIPY